MYYDLDELNHLGTIVRSKIKKDKQFLIKTRKQSDLNYSKALQQIKNIPELQWPSLSKEEFLSLIQKAMYLLRSCGLYGHIIEPFSLTTDVMIKNMLSQYVKEPSELNKVLTIISTPTKRSFLHEMEEDLFTISQINNEKERKQRIKEHLARFYWVRNTYAGRTKLTLKDIENELKTISSNFHDSAKIEKKSELIQQLRLNPELILLLEASDFITDWQDKRKKDIFIAIDIAERVLEELSQRINIEVANLRYLSYPDITLSLFTDKTLPQTLTERRNGVVFYTLPEKEIILTGKEYLEFRERVERKEKPTQQIKKFSGLTASLGTAIGQVKVCKLLSDIRKVKEGDILVTSMTRPEFLPAMEKAAAFITDEGGITSHAAILAREMKKPCIIGTKIATQVLKDGMTVQVKANHGLIQIIE
ncbi:hypothetical protein J4421_05935 [Candidatus Woesearchaeota archaeon]|nr:hypothetical protein [Candidatus Woesearchaeota archaeon]